MEKTISPEERIRRAEERYRARKRGSDIKVSSNNVNVGIGKTVSLYKKLIVKLAICFVICLIFYLIKYNSYIFSETVITQAKNFLNYDMNFQAIYEQIAKTWNNSQIVENLEKNKETKVEESVAENQEAQEQQAEEAANGEAATQETSNEETVPLTKEEETVKYIKENISMIVPVHGIVSSKFGKREATEVVSQNHKGVDIAADEGTKIVAAMDGTVNIASMEGSYGGHLQIVQGEVSTLYAHCKTLYVKQGEEVKQGQEIGEVGQTGNATGPHLHFEISKGEEIIDPQKIIEI